MGLISIILNKVVVISNGTKFELAFNKVVIQIVNLQMASEAVGH